MAAHIQPHALIVGAGIGGLAAAIALRQAGYTAEVFERAPEMRPVGAGLLLWANAVRALDRLGLAGPVKQHSLPEASGAIRTWRGETLMDFSPREIERRLGEISIVIHRAELMQILLDAQPAGSLHLGAAATQVVQNAGGVTLELADGRVAQGDILIGADGLRSAVRGALFGELAPRYSGYTAWRGVAPFDHGRLTPGESMGRGARFGMAPLCGGRAYWYATQNAPAGAPAPTGGAKQHLLGLLQGWHAPVEALIVATDEAAMLHHDIYDLPPLDRWGDRRITLLGDAAHAMTPNLGQGACQALEDAVVLARQLRDAPDLPAALRAYEAERRARTGPIVRQARMIGAIGQWSNPLACGLRDQLMKHVLVHMQGGQLERTAGYRV
jgi:2-polyprenyl-6-methoxyphenol hydroxylase-like FAD-dependent oxidoreductase